MQAHPWIDSHGGRQPYRDDRVVDRRVEGLLDPTKGKDKKREDKRAAKAEKKGKMESTNPAPAEPAAATPAAEPPPAAPVE